MTGQTGEQLYIEGYGRKIKSCAFSGHRLTGEDFDEKKLEEALRALAREETRTFYCGMAEGFDLYAAECVAKLKREYPSLRLVGCIPCVGQEKNYSESEKKKYFRLLDACDVKVILADKYYRGCMLKRNDYMAERADALIAYCRRETGGTAYTVKCFLRRNKPVFQV